MRPSLPYGAAFWALCGINFLVALNEALMTHLPEHLLGSGGSDMTIGVVAAAFSIGALAIRPWAGRRVDRHGRRSVLALGCALIAGATLALSAVPVTGAWFYVGRATQGAAHGMATSALLTLIVDHLRPEDRVRGLGYFTVSGMVPLGAAAPLGNALLRVGSFEILFVVAATLALVALALVLPLRETRAPSADEPSGFWALLVEPRMAPLWIATIGFSVALAGTLTFVKAFDLERSFPVITPFFVAYSVVAIVARVVGGGIPERLGLGRTLGLCLVSFAAGLLVLGVSSGPGVVVLAGAMVGLCHGYATPVLSALAAERVEAPSRGTGMSLLVALLEGGPLLAGPLLATVAEAMGYRAVFIGMASLPLGALASYWALDRRLARRARDTSDAPGSR